jgi:hypothetical protein
MRRLRIDVRSFYRDLEVLRTHGIPLSIQGGRYLLDDDPKSAIERLPFPDPHLTLGEAIRLARGRTSLHRKLKDQVGHIIG